MKSDKFENINVAAALGFALVMLLTSQLLVPVAFAQTTVGVQLEAGIQKEEVDGDLKSAIAAYQKIAKDSSAPRDMRAKALLHLAGCYEKLGQQAQNVYQQIVRDFADQPAATQARARLAALKQGDHPSAPATMTQRKIGTLGPQMGPGDTDGHRAVYLDKASGELIYGDLAGKSKRVIFKPKHPMAFYPSRDFSMVSLQFSNPDKQTTLAVVNIDGTGYREIAKLNGPSTRGLNWSWDNRYLLFSQSQGGNTRLLRISSADGQIRELLTLKTGEVGTASFSLDGRYVAYQVASSVRDPVSRIFVLLAEGGEPHQVYQERSSPEIHGDAQLRLLDWTTDGRYLAISSERTGKAALHLLPMRDGKSAGAPIFVRYGDFEGGVTTAAGGLVYSSVKPGGPWAVYLASLDSNGRPNGWKRLDLLLGNKWNPFPRWSADSNQIVYVVRNEDAGQSGGQVVHLHNLSTGADREIYHALGYALCSWAVRQPKLFCSDDHAENTDILSIAVDSGEIVRLHTFPAATLLMRYPSRDDHALYMYCLLRVGMLGGKLLRWEIATERETIVEQLPPAGYGWVSWDERWLIRFDNQKQGIEIRPTSGADWRLVSKPLLPTSHINTTPDGEWLVYHDVDSAGKHGLFRVATAGGQPERLGDFPDNGDGTLEISPDGSKIIVASGDFASGYELWSLENFVPQAPKR